MLCIKKKKLQPRLICSSPPVFFFFCFPGNPHLSCSVTMETDVRVVPSCMATVGVVKRHGQTWAVIHHFIFLWVKGYRAPISIYMTPPFPSPPLPSPPLPYSSDRSRTQMAQSNLIFMISKTFYIHPQHSISTALPIHSLRSRDPFNQRPRPPPSSSVTYSYVKNSPHDLWQVFQ